MTEVYIGLGSNISPEKYMNLVLEELREQLDVLAISPFYRSPAVGTAKGQADFINAMVKVQTELTARELKFDILRETEFKLGRDKDIPKYAARTMDLDIILFGDEIIPQMNIPEAGILRRPFVYIPLLDIAPEITVATLEKTLAEEVAELNAEITCEILSLA